MVIQLHEGQCDGVKLSNKLSDSFCASVPIFFTIFLSMMLKQATIISMMKMLFTLHHLDCSLFALCDDRPMQKMEQLTHDLLLAKDAVLVAPTGLAFQ